MKPTIIKNTIGGIKMKDKAVVVFSGGQDSTTCLIDAIMRHDEVMAVSFDYGQRNHKELSVAKKITEDFGVEHFIVDMNLNEVTTNAMTDHTMEIEIDEIPNTFVAGRNQLFLTYASIRSEERRVGKECRYQSTRKR